MDPALLLTPDIRTLALLLVAVGLLVAAAFAGLWLQGAGGKAAGTWSLGHALGALGYLLIGLRDLIGDPLSVLLADGLLLAGALLLLKGLSIQTARPFPDRLALAGLAGLTGLFSLFVYVWPNPAVRIVLISAAASAVLATCAFRLLNRPARQRNWVHVFTATAFAGVAGIQLLRAAASLVLPPGENLTAATAVHATSLTVLMLGMVAWALGFLWMVTLGWRQDLEREVEARRRSERAVRESERRFRTIFDYSPSGIAFGDEEGNLLTVNAAFSRLLGYSRQELMGRNFAEITHPEDREREAALIQDLLWEGKSHYRLEKRYLARDGTPVWVDLIVSAQWNGHGIPIHFIGVATDIREKKAAEAELEYRAAYDSLTGALNRLRYEQLLEQEQERVNRYGTQAAVIMFDIDHFKAVNDTYGHDTGDAVLTELAGLVRGRLRETDSLSRWGGEEFLILLPETGLEGATRLAEDIRATTEAHSFPEVGRVTISLGVADLLPGEPYRDLVRRVDQALYAAKRGGRNQVRQAARTAPASSEPAS